MTGSCIAAIISVGFGVNASAIGVGGIPGFLSIMPQFWGAFFLAMAAAIVIPFVLTLIIGKKRLTTEDRITTVDTEQEAPAAAPAAFTKAEESEEIASPASGKLIAIEDVPDQAFASKAMGDGFAIEPTDGKIVAPFSGTVTVAFPTGHAYGIKAANGKEVLIHIGMDTVELEGKGFHGRVKQGDTVHQGDVLTEVDLDYIKSQGKSAVTPVILTDGTAVTLLKKDQSVQAGETGIAKLS